MSSGECKYVWVELRLEIMGWNEMNGKTNQRLLYARVSAFHVELLCDNSVSLNSDMTPGVR